MWSALAEKQVSIPHIVSNVLIHTCRAQLAITQLFRTLQCIRMDLDQANDNDKLVESLIPMWEEEKQRIGASPSHHSPVCERDPKPLCDAIQAGHCALQVSYALGVTSLSM